MAQSNDPPRQNGKPEPRSIVRWLKERLSRDDESSLRESVAELIEDFEEEQDDAEGLDERRLLKNVLKLGELTAEDIMVPRADIVAVEVSTPLDELVRQMSREAHSRMPVYRERLDDVIGMVHIKDVLAYWHGKDGFSLQRVMRKVLFVAPSMRAMDLILEMRTSRTHIALVVDEYGGIDGLVTIEDLVEQIVGEIEDEHDVDEGPMVVRRADNTLAADARATLDELEAETGPVLSEDERREIDTIGGLVVGLAGRVPVRGEILRHPSALEFEVLESDARRVRRLRVRNLPLKPAGD